MESKAVGNRPSMTKFRILVLAAAILTYLLIVWGVVLRVTDTGLACPDWPLCFGAWQPPTVQQALITYVHRIAALLVGLVLLTALVIAWKRYRYRGWILRPLVWAFLIFLVQGALGGLVVFFRAPEQIVAAHLGLSLLIQSLIIIPAVLSIYISRTQTDHVRLTFRTPFARLSFLTLSTTYLLLISGTFVTASKGTSACLYWPICDGSFIPVSFWGWINLIHRLISGVAGLLMLLLLISAWRTQRSQTAVLVSTTAGGVLFGAQALMGAFEVTEGYPAYLVGIHSATAVAVMGVLVVQVVLTGLAARTVEEEKAESLEPVWRPGIVKDLLILTKPIVVALLLVTTFAGMVIGSKAWPSLGLVFWTLLGGAMAAGGSGAINQYIDRFDDIKMQRTSGRPIPAGRLTPGEGLAFGVALTLSSFFLLVAFVNFLAALLALTGIIYYVLIYSILLKKITVQNIVIGGGAGAIPPLVGWAAATGHLNVPSLFLFAVVFMWTPPHFWALALVRRKDYARAGVPMLPVVRGESETRWQIFLYTIELVALTLVLPLLGLGGGLYFVAAIVLGGLLVYSAWKVWRGKGNKVAWRMYRYSSMYLAFLFVALMIDALI